MVEALGLAAMAELPAVLIDAQRAGPSTGMPTRHEQGDLWLVAMGAHGVASRVFFPLFGSLISYGGVGAAGAPGQLPLAELYAELRRYSPEFAAAHP